MIGFGNIGGFAQGAASGAFQALQVVFILGIIGFGAYVVLNERRFKIKAVIGRVLNNGKRVWYVDRAKVVRSKRQGTRWKFKKNGMKDPAPEEVQEITGSGKILLFGAEDSNGSVVWHDPNITKANLDAQDYRPVTNNDKRALRYEMAMAQGYTENMLTKFGLPIAYGFVMVMIIAVFLLFYGKAIEPINEAAKTTGSNLVDMKNLEKEIVDIKRETASIKAGIQRISDVEKPLQGGNVTGGAE